MSQKNVVQLECDICHIKKIHCDTCNDEGVFDSAVECFDCNGQGMHVLGSNVVCDECYRILIKAKKIELSFDA